MSNEMKYKNFTEIPVWQLAHKSTLEIYKLTANFPREELYGLSSQLKRAASSVPANITEGFYRNTTKELIQFLFNSRGSAGEVIYHLILSKDLKYISDTNFNKMKENYELIGKQLNGWIKSLKIKLDEK